MQRTTIAGWVMAAAMAVAASQILAQQDEGPILRPKVLPAKPAGATLLVTCDLACNWELDGKVKVEFGQHLAVAKSEDALDQVQQLVNVEKPGQTIVNIELLPLRTSRIKSEEAVAETTGTVWRDNKTGLLWTKTDNGTSLDWMQASSYCWNLNLANLSGWRLPTIEELETIYDPSIMLSHRRPMKMTL